MIHAAVAWRKYLSKNKLFIGILSTAPRSGNSGGEVR